MKKRDDFNSTTKKKLEERVGNRCSKPDCGIRTRGAASGDDGTINTGFAAHITAASPGGPRYDPGLTSNQRKHHSNGIWLCGTHAKLVDSDEGHFTVEELRSWKRTAVQRSFTEVISSKPCPVGALLADAENVQTTIDLLLDCSKLDLSAFRNKPAWNSHAIFLNLKMVTETSNEMFTVCDLASAIEVFDEISVIAPPGTGKTTTLLQLTEAVLYNGSCVAVFVPLSEWSTRSDTFFQSVARRRAFRDANERQFERLTEDGRLVLILDGWNELDEASKRRARNDVKSLRRDFPDIRLVVSSRYKDFDIPIDGPVVEIDVLTEGQQLEIAKALRGPQGESLMDHAWRTSGLRELVAIPLYLTALLKRVPGGSLPNTKEEVLRSFVLELEQDPDKMATLREELQGFHRDFLEAIAVEVTRQGVVTISEAQARAVVNIVQDRLKADKQIEQFLQAMKVLKALVSAHMLVRSGEESGGVSFQHQQFQEWFASFWVQQLMLTSASGDNKNKKMLRETVLDIPIWEEVVLFACDRLSRADQNGIQAVASAILETLGIDPLLSAEMIYRSSDEVWEQVRDNVISFVGKWHTKGRVDRAVKFMIDTGRAEFSQYIWPLISNPDDQVHLSALRAGRKFRVSVLGSDSQKRIAALPEDLRVNLIVEIAMNGGMDGIEFATLLAKNDESSKVKESVIGSLLFRHADRFAKDILESAPDEIWRSLAKEWHFREINDPQVSTRIQQEAAQLFVEETDSCQILNMLLISNVRDSETGTKIRRLIEKIDFSEKSRENEWLIHRAHELYPGDVVGALLSKLESCKPLPFRTEEFLRASDVVIEEGPLVELVLHNSGEEKKSEMVAGIVGPKIIVQLIDQMFLIHTRIKASNGKYDKALSDEYHRLYRWISKSKLVSFIQAVLELSETENPNKIEVLADLVSGHRVSAEREPLRLEAKSHELVTAAVRRWAEILLASSEATRSQFAKIAMAAERLSSPVLVPALQQLLSEDLERLKREIEDSAEARKRGRKIQHYGYTSWNLQYRSAFASIGDDQTVQIMKAYLPNPDFGFDAAYVLKAVCKESQPVEYLSGFLRSQPDFSVVPQQYIQRQSKIGIVTHAFVNEILAVVDELIKPDAEDADYKHALKLATIAFSMPYVDKADMIASLLQLPLPAIDKIDLLNVLVLSWEIIPSEVVLQGIDELLTKAKARPWMLQEQNGWRLNEWLRLLPFTEMPGSILDVLDRLDDRQLQPWNLRGLLSALSYAPSIEAENVLIELAKRDNWFLSEYDWLAALTKRNTLKAARIFLDMVCSTSFHGKRGSNRPSIMDYGNMLLGFMDSHKQFRKEVYKRFPSVADEPAKSVLEYAIADAADIEGVLLLVRVSAAQGKLFGSTKLYNALRRVLVSHTPIGPSGMQQLYILPAPELRKCLFDMVVKGNTAESRLAIGCLNAIDEIRDDYGHADVEPRHPNIAMGVPWPQIDLAEPT